MYKESMCQGCEQHKIKKVEIIMTYFWFFALLSSQSAFTSVQNHFGISSNHIRSNESPYRLSWDNAPMRTRWMRGHSDRDLWPSTCLSFSLGGRPSQIWRNSCCITLARMRHTYVWTTKKLVWHCLISTISMLIIKQENNILVTHGNL